MRYFAKKTSAAGASPAKRSLDVSEYSAELDSSKPEIFRIVKISGTKVTQDTMTLQAASADEASAWVQAFNDSRARGLSKIAASDAPSRNEGITAHRLNEPNGRTSEDGFNRQTMVSESHELTDANAKGNDGLSSPRIGKDFGSVLPRSQAPDVNTIGTLTPTDGKSPISPRHSDVARGENETDNISSPIVHKKNSSLFEEGVMMGEAVEEDDAMAGGPSQHVTLTPQRTSSLIDAVIQKRDDDEGFSTPQRVETTDSGDDIDEAKYFDFEEEDIPDAPNIPLPPTPLQVALVFRLSSFQQL